MNKEQMRERAAAWCLRLESRALEASELAELHDWLSEDPAHARYLEQMQHLWSITGNLGHPAQLLDSSLEQGNRAARTSRSVSRGLLAFAATLVAITVLTGIVYLTRDTSVVYATAVGEQRSIALDDGTTIYLNSDSELRVRYSVNERAIALERGQAMFSVVRNPSRPFLVTTGAISIRVLGTEFDVYESAAGTRVAVLKGEVEVRSDGDSLGASAWRKTLVSGTGIRVTPDSGSYQIETVDVARVEAWRLGRLEFSNVSLAEAIAELNRYTVSDLIIGDPTLHRIRISAVLNIRDQEKFLTILERLWGVRAERDAQGNIVLRAGD